jgi:hypothetical protein
MKTRYDRTHEDVEFSKGDLVTLFTPKVKEGISAKLQSKNQGPYKIVERNSPVNYTIACTISESTRSKIDPVF